MYLELKGKNNLTNTTKTEKFKIKVLF